MNTNDTQKLSLSDFSPETYKQLNIDLKDMTDIEAKVHYECNGHLENCKYKL